MARRPFIYIRTNHDFVAGAWQWLALVAAGRWVCIAVSPIRSRLERLRTGRRRVVATGPGPRNIGVEIDGGLVVIPRGNLVAVPEKTSAGKPRSGKR